MFKVKNKDTGTTIVLVSLSKGNFTIYNNFHRDLL